MAILLLSHIFAKTICKWGRLLIGYNRGETLPSICVDEGFIQNRSSIRTTQGIYYIYSIFRDTIVVVEKHRFKACIVNRRPINYYRLISMLKVIFSHYNYDLWAAELMIWGWYFILVVGRWSVFYCNLGGFLYVQWESELDSLCRINSRIFAIKKNGQCFELNWSIHLPTWTKEQEIKLGGTH